MVSNRRRGEPAIPDNYKEFLTLEQIDALRKLESFGWSLKFVRRPKFEPVEIIVCHGERDYHAILAEDGELDQKTPVRVRDESKEKVAVEESPTEDPWANASDDMELQLPETASPPARESPGVGKEPIPTPQDDGLQDSGDKPPPKYIV